MKIRIAAMTAAAIVAATTAWTGDVSFTYKPTVKKTADKYTITFAVSAPTDVEVAILAGTNVVRHLAAGVLGGTNPSTGSGPAGAPPEPLKPGLAQELTWDGKDDFGHQVSGFRFQDGASSSLTPDTRLPAVASEAKAGHLTPDTPLRLRVRAGIGVKFGRYIGEDPCNFGSLESVVADEAGNVYIAGSRGDGNQMAMCLRVFDSEGRYLREIAPFPANLPPDAMKEIARWDAEANCWRPRNLRNLNPDFYGQPGGYWGNPAFSLVGVSKEGGLILTDGGRIFRLAGDGSVPGNSFAEGALWGKKGLPNTGGGPLHLKPSPDGKYLYLSGPFSSNTQYGHVADPAFPPGQVYRMEVGKGTMEPFVKLPTIGSRVDSGWTSKLISHPGNYTVPHGPIHGLAVDKDGNVFVADQDGQRVAVFDSAGQELGKMDVPYPDIVAVHPRSGAVYVVTKEIKGYQQYKKTLVKFSGYKDAKQEAILDLGTDPTAMPQMALAAGGKTTVLWISGVRGGLLTVEDKGAALEPVKNQFSPRSDVPRDWERLAVDYNRDEIYISNGCVNFWRYNGQTGEGDVLKKDGKPFNGTDLAVGGDGLLYVRSGGSFSGPLERLTRDLAPAPYEATGTHVLSPYIYSRMGNGMAERGLGVGLNGNVYLSFMYKWVAYALGGFGSDGKPLEGKYLKETYPAEKPEERKKYAPGMNGAILGPLPDMNGGVRVDTKGDIYVGLYHRPKGFTPPKGFEKDQGYRVTVGSVVKFPAAGGAVPADALRVYPGLAPFSSAMEGFGGNSCCVCRVPRFDIDRYNRVIMPNAMTSSVLLYDNAGNLIIEFGKYGNFDSLFVNGNTDAGKQGKPTVAAPEIPLAWPTGAGFSENAFYVLDTYNRRAVRVDLTYKTEESCEVK